MSRSNLSEQLQVALDVYACTEGLSRSDVITRLEDATPAARSTIRQDILGYIKQPDVERLRVYADVLDVPARGLVRAARADGIMYDLDWFGQKGRDTARSPGELRYDDTSESEEWSAPTWGDWKSALDLPDDATWDSVDNDVKGKVVSTTAFGGTSADTFSDANWYPLIDPPGTLVFGALDSAWKTAGKAPDPDSLRSTLETLANRHFDHSFEDDESSIHVMPQAKNERAPEVMLDSTLDFKDSGPQKVVPFTDEITAPDTEFKGSTGAEVKDVDRSSNIVTGYYAAWSPDSDGERFVKGAFADSIKKFGPQAEKQRIVHLNQHMVHQPIGRPIMLEEDDHGLKFQTLIPETRKGEDVLKLYAADVITEHSVGFKRKSEDQDDDGQTLIKKALMLEGSNVTWGANEDTPFTGFKSPEAAFEHLVDYLGGLRGVLKEGLTEVTAKQVELGIEQVESELRRLMEQTARVAKDVDNANADALKQERLSKAIQNFGEQISIIDDANAKDSLKHGGTVDINLPKFDLGSKEESEEKDITKIVPDINFGGNDE